MATLRRITPIDGGVNYTFRIEFHNRGHLCEAAMWVQETRIPGSWIGNEFYTYGEHATCLMLKFGYDCK